MSKDILPSVAERRADLRKATKHARTGVVRMNKLVPVPRDPALHQARRESVLKAARKVFEAKGLEGASIRLIAKAAKCTTGSIYPYFEGKEEIYAEVLSRSLVDYKKNLVGAVEKAPDPEAKFQAALSAHFGFYEKRPNDMSLALYLFNGLKPQGLTRELDARLNAQLASIVGVFIECLRALSNCTQREAEIEVGLHLAMLFGLLTLHHTKRIKAFHIDARALLKLHMQHSVDRLRAGGSQHRVTS
jgi:TetR/AcrR family transcriptional regulator